MEAKEKSSSGIDWFDISSILCCVLGWLFGPGFFFIGIGIALGKMNVTKNFNYQPMHMNIGSGFLIYIVLPLLTVLFGIG